jgi:hypothetical protein
MKKAKKKERRLRQVETWLRLHFPPATTVVVIHGDFGKKWYADALLTKGGFVIRVNTHWRICHCIDAMLHEWAHAYPLCYTHGIKWGQRYQPIYEGFNDAGGDEESRTL